MTHSRAIFIIAASLLFLISCIEEKQYLPPIKQVSKVDINRYLGLWYEIARIDHSFQKDCVASTAEYSLRSDGYIRVVNKCRKKDIQGDLAVAEGKAWVVDKDTNAWLKVQFFWPFRGDYVIIDLDERDYSYAVVGHPSRDYLWVLSRSPEMDKERFQEIMTRISKQGYDLNRITKYPQIEIKR
jgi:apolipoprotein D and lipocalin family protein